MNETNKSECRSMLTAAVAFAHVFNKGLPQQGSLGTNPEVVASDVDAFVEALLVNLESREKLDEARFEQVDG